MTTQAELHAFALLGLPVTASETDLRSARRTLVRQNHPDLVRKDRAEADKRLAEIRDVGTDSFPDPTRYIAPSIPIRGQRTGPSSFVVRFSGLMANCASGIRRDALRAGVATFPDL